MPGYLAVDIGPYSPEECVDGVFCEVRPYANGSLRP